jgi:hypothetical protein
MSTSLTLVRHRARLHWFADGLPQILGGLPAILFGFYLASDGPQHRSTLSSILSISAMFLYAALLPGSKPLLEWLKQRITYPRTGYAAPPYFTEDPHSLNTDQLSLMQADTRSKDEIAQVRHERTRRTILLLVLMIGYSLALLLVRSPWICFPVGVLTGIAIWLGSRKDEHFSLWIPFGLGLLGLYLSQLTLNPLERIGRILVGIGILFVTEGLIKLFRFLHQNPLPKPAAPQQGPRA